MSLSKMQTQIQIQIKMSEIETVLNFWFPTKPIKSANAYQEFWFSNIYDLEIKERFGPILNILEELDTDLIINNIKNIAVSDRSKFLLGIIICLDQFSRNIYRSSVDKNIYCNDEKCFAIVSEYIYEIQNYPIDRRIFMLLPFRHQKKTDLLDFVVDHIMKMEDEISKIENTDLFRKYNSIMRKFKNATMMDYSKVTDTIRCNLHEKTSSEYHVSPNTIKTMPEILDKNCLKYDTLQILCNKTVEYPFEDPTVKSSKIYNILKTFYSTRNIDSVIVSLSGGVDSMVISYILHHLKLSHVIKSVCAVHVDYGNRSISKAESDFVETWCSFLKIPFITRRIEHMRRDNSILNIEKSVYEAGTKEVRFNLYKYSMKKYDAKSVILGHHADDLAENVLMNTIRGNDILDLYTMVDHQIIKDVPIDRPLLVIHKDEIFDFAHRYEIPYLADTTPESCLRGAIRKKVFPDLENVDKSIRQSLMSVGTQSEMWNSVIQTMIINPMLDRFKTHRFGATLELISEHNYGSLPDIVWTTVLTKVFHCKLKKNMVSNKNMKILLRWLSMVFSGKEDLKKNIINLSNGYVIFMYCNTLVILDKTFISLSDQKCSDFNPDLNSGINIEDRKIVFGNWCMEFSKIPDNSNSNSKNLPEKTEISVSDLMRGEFEICVSAKTITRISSSNISDLIHPKKVYLYRSYGMSVNDPEFSKIYKISHNGDKNLSYTKYMKDFVLAKYIPKLHFFKDLESKTDNMYFKIKYSRI